MELFMMGAVAGVLGTLAMDSLNHLFSRTGLVSKIDVRMIGRMSAGWARGRFRYRNPGEIEPKPNERLYGILAHYAIGLALAFIYVVGWDLWVEGPISSGGAVVYGIGTTVASWFFVYPSMGLGVGGTRSPERIKNPLSSLANHLFFGIGMAIGVALT